MRRISHPRAVGTWMSRVTPSDVHGKPLGAAIQNWTQRVVLPIDFAKSLTGTKSARRSVIGGSHNRSLAPGKAPEDDGIQLAVKAANIVFYATYIDLVQELPAEHAEVLLSGSADVYRQASNLKFNRTSVWRW